MTILHMETDTVRATASQLAQAADLIRDEIRSAFQAAASADWIGSSRDQFMSEVDSIARQAEEISQQVSVLGLRIDREADEWERIGESRVNAPIALPIVIIGGVVGIGLVTGGILSWWMSKDLTDMTDEEAYKKIEDILDNSKAGRKALEEAERLGVKVELGEKGKGTYYDPDSEPPTMYIDPLTQEDMAASSFVHELTHAAQDKTGDLWDPTAVGKDTYLSHCLTNEADAVIAELRYEKENFILDKVSQPPWETAYWEAYNQKLKELKSNSASMGSAEIEKIASDFGREKIIEAYRDGTITTSTTGESYVDYYGGGWERANAQTNPVI